MRQFLAIAAAITAFGFCAPALAQELTQDDIDNAQAAIEAADLSDEAYLNLWCGAAFGIMQQKAADQGDAATADQLAQLQTTVFTKAAIELQAEGVSQEDFSTLGTNFAYLVMSQGKDAGGEADFTQDDCAAAAQP